MNPRALAYGLAFAAPLWVLIAAAVWWFRAELAAVGTVAVAVAPWLVPMLAAFAVVGWAERRGLL